MKISLIGMSGVGKTYWSKKLERNGFKRFGCDDLIEGMLKPELKKSGFKGIQDVTKWMGQPFEKHHKNASRKYLFFEEQVVNKIVDYLEKSDPDEDLVVDTTGSVIYIDKNILKRLSNSSKIIYFHAPSSFKKQLFEEYLKNPKPVYWGKSFNKKIGEDNFSALARCYPDFLEYRSREYEKLAHEIICYRTHKSQETKAEHLVELFKLYD